MRQRGTAVRRIRIIHSAAHAIAGVRRARSATPRVMRTETNAGPIVVMSAPRRVFSFASNDGTVARDDARANRLAADSLVFDREAVVETRFKEVIQKKIFASNLAESSATRPPSSMLARVAGSIMTTFARARRARKKRRIS